MSEEQPRKDYKASIEAGLHRLEQEKLSFLGNSSVISKFDVENLETYAAELGLDDDDGDETEVCDRDISPTASFDGMRTMSDVQFVDADVMLDANKSASPDTPTIDLEDHASEELSDVNTIVANNSFRQSHKLASGMQTLGSGDLVVSKDTPSADLSLKSAQDVSVFAEAEDWDNSKTNELGKFADHVRMQLEQAKTDAVGKSATQIRFALEQAKTNDIGNCAKEVRIALEQAKTNDVGKCADVVRIALEQAKTNDIGKCADDVRAALEMAKTNDLGKSVDEVRAALEMAKTNDLGKSVDEVRAAIALAKTDNLGDSAVKLNAILAREADEEDATLPERDFLEYAKTTDLGHQAELVREALAQGLTLAPPQVENPSVSKGQVLKLASGSPNTPTPAAPASAMDKLKQQGIFEPLAVHAEVANNIKNIQTLDNILPQSSVKPWSGEFDSSDETIPQDPNFIKAIKDNAHPGIINRKPSQAEIELESRETIPINLTEIPLKELGGDALHRNKTLPLKRRKLETPIKAQTVIVQPKHRSNGWLWGIVFFLLLCAICYIMYLSGILGAISPKLAPHRPTHATITTVPIMLDTQELQESIEQASLAVGQAMQFDNWLESWTETRVNQQVSPEGRMPYIELAMAYYPDQPRHAQRYIEACIDAGQYEKARETLDGLSPELKKNDALRSLKYKIWQSDTHFISPTVTLTDEMCEAISPLGGGSTLTFKCEKAGEPVGAFKPLQTRKQSNYRAEIAAWRLCQLIECDFSIPWNRPVRIERNLFNQLYNRSKSKKKESYRKELVDIIWTKDGDGSFVYGTLKDWVPDFTRFPIEYKVFWQPWVSQSHYIQSFKPLNEALAPLSRNTHTAKLLGSLLDQSPNLTTEQLAAQVSEVLVFDFLIGNWDRFSGVPDWWGVNCQYKDNQIVSIDNGAAFPAYSNDKVYERFMLVERFSEHFIEALRNLDKEQTFKMLFPSPSKHETDSFEQFWRQRNQVLNRVDTLSEKYGVEHVLSFK